MKIDYKWCVFSGIIIILIIYIGLFIHSLTQMTLATMLSGRNIHYHFTFFGGKVYAEKLDTSSTRIFLLSGSMGAIVYGILMIIIAYNLNDERIALGGYGIIFWNVISWIISPYIKYGDFYEYLQTDKNMTPEFVTLFLIIFFCIIILMCISSVYKIHQNKRLWKVFF